MWCTERASVWGSLLIGLFGLGLVAAGVFVTDPGSGYPPGAPLKGDPQTWHGYVHGINAVVLFALLIVACFVLARRFAADSQNQSWATYSWMTGALLLLIVVLSTESAPIPENRSSRTGFFGSIREFHPIAHLHPSSAAVPAASHVSRRRLTAAHHWRQVPTFQGKSC